MKAVICLLAIIAGANAGIFLGGLNIGLGGGPVNSAWSNGGWSGGNGGGWSGGYGGGWNFGKSITIPNIVKVFEAPAPIVPPAPVQIVKVIRETQPIVAPAWKIVKVIQPSYGWD